MHRGKIQIIVLNDIIAASFSCPSLFTVLPIFSREIINGKICTAAHSSIMRLNEPSMEKLIGLIETSVKMQMFSANGPRQVLLLTLNHLDSVREMTCIKQLKQTIDLVQHNFSQIYGKMTNGEIIRIRYTILNYLQDVHIKVTTFIKEGLQRYNGSFVAIGKWTIPHDCEAPGVIRIFNKNGTLNDISTFHPISFYKVETETGSLELNSPRKTNLGLSLFKINSNDDEQSERSDPLFFCQTIRNGYKQEMDLFVTQLLGNEISKNNNDGLDLELPDPLLSTTRKKAKDVKIEENNTIQLTVNAPTLKNIRIQMNDTASRETEDVMNMLQLLEME
ncbi:protein OSCP1 isoform X2 [Adelges cooleyi]|uniref:protein OSCP1 isoform X2 n=1 Tax=Adelges cooleyi TaxID=133065 RepID=UPI00217FD966|nr:protein OSCP1 isoform X2 [Adelges cooleyi]